MKKILEVTLSDEGKIKFASEFNVKKDASTIPDIITASLFTMVTELWGGNEQSVLAIIRALAVADLAACENRSEMVGFLDMESNNLASALRKSMHVMEAQGLCQTFAPGIPRPIKN